MQSIHEAAANAQSRSQRMEPQPNARSHNMLTYVVNEDSFYADMEISICCNIYAITKTFLRSLHGQRNSFICRETLQPM